MTKLLEIGDVIVFIWKHPANRGRRLRQLRHAVAFQIKGRILGKRTLSHVGEALLWSELHITSSSRAVYANPPDVPEMLVWQRYLRPGDFFVDIGANVGLYTLWASQLGASVLAVEPDLGSYQRLVENVALNDFQVDTHCVAVLASSGSALLTQSHGAMNFISVDERPIGQASRVPVTTLDALIGRRSVAGVKIDVEGTERLVLRGAHAALSEQRIGLIQLEWNRRSVDVLGETRAPVARLLRENGYSLYRPNPEGRLSEIADDGFGSDVFAAVQGTIFA